MVEGDLKWYSLITNCIMDFINFMPHANIMIFRLGFTDGDTSGSSAFIVFGLVTFI